MDCKIPFYNLLNMLFVGVIFGICWIFIDPHNTSLALRTFQMILNNKSSEMFCLPFFAYLIGLTINRIASLLFEKIFNTKKRSDQRNWISRQIQIEWRSYKAYIDAEKKDQKLIILSREYALSRNLTVMFFILCIMSIINTKLNLAIFFASLGILFYFSAKKHVKKIVERTDEALKKHI